MLFPIFGVARAAATAFGAGFSRWAADALYTAFLSLVNISCGTADDNAENYNDNKILHKRNTSFRYALLPLRAYSALSFFSALTQR